MAKKSTPKTKLSFIDIVVKGIQEKKGTDITIIDLRDVMNSYSDYFVVCTGTSDTNVQAICDSVEDIVRTTLNDKPTHIEGFREANWILMDYFDTLVHVFKQEEREFYRLEDLWADAKITKIADN